MATAESSPIPQTGIYSIKGGTNCFRDRICPRCVKPLPKGRRHHYCSLCLSAYRREQADYPNRRCCRCRKKLSVGRISNYCATCQQQKDKARYLAIKQAEKVCRNCEEPLQKGRSINLCTACTTATSKEYRRRQKRCPCGEPKKASWTIYCAYCRREKKYEGAVRRRLREKASGVQEG